MLLIIYNRYKQEKGVINGSRITKVRYISQYSCEIHSIFLLQFALTKAPLISDFYFPGVGIRVGGTNQNQ